MDAKEMLPCKRGHIDRYPNGRCRSCAIDRAIEWAKNNPDRAKQNQANRDFSKVKASDKKKYQLNKPQIIDRSTAWRKANPLKVYEINRKWALANPHMRAIYNANRRVAVRLATPDWADHCEIEKIYRQAQEMTRITGIRYSVDHVLPLKHKGVCGLHVHYNLAVIPYVENCSKGNRGDI